MSGEILDVERVETGTAAVTAVLERISKARITGDVSAGVLEYGQSVKSRAVDAKVKGTAQGQPKKKRR